MSDEPILAKLVREADDRDRRTNVPVARERAEAYLDVMVASARRGRGFN